MKPAQAQLTKALLAFGFSKTEIRIYLALVAHSPLSVLALSRETDIPRTTLYDMLEVLAQKGFVYKREERRGVLYEAASPQTLKTDFEKRQQLFTNALELIEYVHGDTVRRPATSLLEGTNGFRQLWQRIFDSGVREYCMITSGMTFLDFVKEDYLIKQIIAERISRNIQSRQLIPESPLAKKIALKDKEEHRQSRFLPKGTSFPTTIIIFGNEVAFLTTRRENTVIIVMSGETALTFRGLFELLWSQARLYT